METNLYLVSVGIGDIDNITLKAVKTIESADIVFAMDFVKEQFQDYLTNKEVYDAGHGLFTPMGRRGKDETEVLTEEDKIRKIIRQAVFAGKTVAILDFGDPTIYSPQAGYLKEFADLNPVIIPGISSFNAASAALGKELSNSYDAAIVLTKAVKTETGKIAKLAQTKSTMILFTMNMDLPNVVSELKLHYEGDTPVAIVSAAGFKDRENIIKATLDTILDVVSNDDLPWEHLLYVGDFLK
ncbi:MAG: SAM-dependent methyltransferase [Alphaproteobacteria bacterium]